MADAKISALTEETAPADEDLLALVVDPSGTPASRKVTRANLFSGKAMPSRILFGGTDPGYPTDMAVGERTGNFDLTVDILFANPLWVPRAMELTALMAEVSTSAVSGEVRVGLYTDDGSFYPDALVKDSGVLDASSTGDKTATFTAVAVSAGLHWIAIISNDSSIDVQGFNRSQIVARWAGTSVDIGRIHGYLEVDQTYGALPDPFTAGGFWRRVAGDPAMPAPFARLVNV